MIALNTKQAAAYVGLSFGSFSRAVAAGLIPYDAHPHGGRKFRPEDLDAYLARVHTRARRTPAAVTSKVEYSARLERTRRQAEKEIAH